MRVLHVLRDLSRNGGVQRLVHDMASVSARYNVHAEVMYYCDDAGPDYAGSLREHNVPVHHVQRIDLVQQQALMSRADIVHAHLFPALYFTALLRPGSIYTEHNTTNNRRKRAFLKPIERWAYQRFGQITCISPEVESALLGFLGPRTKVSTKVLYNGVDVQQLQGAARAARDKLISHKGFHVAMVGSLTVKKDQACLIRALAHLPSDVQLHLAGDGPRKEELRALAQATNVADRVHFHGVTSDIPAFLAQADLYVQSSHWEGFGLAAIEAMACGVGTLCSDVPGLNNLCGDPAPLFTSGDDQALAAAITAFRNDPGFRAKISAIGEATARRYSLDEMMNSMLQQYRSLAQPASRIA